MTDKARTMNITKTKTLVEKNFINYFDTKLFTVLVLYEVEYRMLCIQYLVTLSTSQTTNNPQSLYNNLIMKITCYTEENEEEINEWREKSFYLMQRKMKNDVSHSQSQTPSSAIIQLIVG